MFTGIITDVGRILAVSDAGDRRLRIATAYAPASIAMGASIACSGACLTVVDKGETDGQGWFDVDVSAETLSKTSLGDWTSGLSVNLERALKVGDELGGHIVTGHVDGVGRILSITPEGDSRRFRFAAPAALAGSIAPKGSVALDGVSLTVNEVEDTADGVQFGINIIPHTQAMTTLGQARAGDRVNIEIDVLVRYVARLTAVKS